MGRLCSVSEFSRRFASGNVMVGENGDFIFIDTAQSVRHLNTRGALFSFFSIWQKEISNYFETMLHMAKKNLTPEESTCRRCIYSTWFCGDRFNNFSPLQMMKTVKASVLAGCEFGEETIIRALMYMDDGIERSS